MYPLRTVCSAILMSSLVFAYPGISCAAETAGATIAGKSADFRTGLVQKMVELSRNGDNNGVLDARNAIEEQPPVARGQRREARKLNATGLGLMAKNQYPAALDALKAAQAADPSDAEIVNNLAYALYRSARLPEAEQALYQTLALAPARAAAWGNLGDVLASLGQEDNAIACYRNAYRFSRAPEKTVAYFSQQRESERDERVQRALSKALPTLNAAGKIGNDAERGAVSNGAARVQPVAAPAAEPAKVNAYALYKLVRTGDKAALKSLRQLADERNSMAQYLVGLATEYGYATAADPALAFAWYRKAADQGLSVAQYVLAYNLNKGIGAERNDEEAARLYGQAAEQGLADAQNNLAVMYGRGEPMAQDAEKAFQLYRLAAEQGNAMAQLNLGRVYQAGRGVEADPVRAANWFRRAADKGLATAQFKLALAYEYGQGLDKDKSQAIAWYKQAAEQGLESAREALKRLGAAE